MAFATNDGHRIYYELEGTGPPLVLHHGFSGTHKRWRRHGYVDALRAHYRVILIDALGHGASDKPHDPARYHIQRQASDVVAVLDTVGIGRTHYWGFSMGGRIAFALAKHFAPRLQSLIIGAAHPYERTLPADECSDGSDPEAFVRTLYRRTGADLTALPRETREELFANDFRALSAVQQDWPSLEDALPTIRAPTLLYVGDADPYLEKVRAVAKLIPGSHLVILEGLDHGTAFREARQVLPHVKAFLTSTEVAALKTP
jgi:pimeloyl-ACP methyl ester carboxylesterase